MSDRNQVEEVRELLGRAVDDVPVPVGRGSESVFASVRRVRRRRRAAMTGAVAAVAAAGVLGSGALPGDGGQRSVAATPGTKGAGIEKLLPGDVGKIRKVSLQQLMTGTKPKTTKGKGPYDGDYAVTRGGATGYVSVHVFRGGKGVPVDLCAGSRTPSRKDGIEQCTTEKLPDGGLLNLWRHAPWKDAGGIMHGASLHARVVLRGGTMVTVQDSAGFLGKGSLGPVMKGYPLTREQLRALALNPELLP
ncbi:hypothetical protein C3489_28150 [Streptomyces sp. Ru71]|uniref:hypothetical protein n=1 Tax=Streptomyces sp. Ru71 TaxID=2080746 RepID=UPI000CDD59E1|nr:hypothetical protein [Streptomyces sp. Ru71]POX47977.1 hypothetical protein C3489_28150 [Streptomyces sp. Ru71]